MSVLPAGDGVRNAWDTVLDAETRMAAAQVGPHPSWADCDEPPTIARVPAANERIITPSAALLAQ